MTFITSILSLLAKLLPFLGAYKAGRDGAYRKNAEDQLKAIEEAKRSDEDVDSMDSDTRREWLRDRLK